MNPAEASGHPDQWRRCAPRGGTWRDRQRSQQACHFAAGKRREDAQKNSGKAQWLHIDPEGSKHCIIPDTSDRTERVGAGTLDDLIKRSTGLELAAQATPLPAVFSSEGIPLFLPRGLSPTYHRMRWMSVIVACLSILPLATSLRAIGEVHPKSFVVRVTDQDSGRPVPLVEFRTTHQARFVTDNA